MHIYDIEDAVAGHDLHGLQRAFRLLVEYPQLGPVDGARSGAKLDSLLDEVAGALRLDQTPMPEDLQRSVEHMTGVTLEASATFAQGAIIVFEFRDRWCACHAHGISAAA